MAVLQSATKPLLLSEINERAELRLTDTNRVLSRFLKKGRVQRIQVLMSEPCRGFIARWGDWRRPRKMFLYQLVDNGD